MQQFEWVHAAWLGFAIVLEILANVLLKFSDGFRRKLYGLMSIAAVLGAFSALSQAVKGIYLSVAYALWSGFGIAATLAAGPDIAPASPARARSPIRTSKFGVRAQAMCSARLSDRPAMTSSGPSTAEVRTKTVCNWPATAVVTPRSAASASSRPAKMKAPDPNANVTMVRTKMRGFMRPA